MTKLYKRVTLSVFAISLMLLGMTLLPVKAAYIQTQLETTEQNLTADENGHTYLYIPELPDFSRWTSSNQVHDEDIDFVEYAYYSTGWDSSSSSYTGPASRRTYMASPISFGFGWLDTWNVLPAFYDYGNTTNDPLSISIENERIVFPLTIGEEVSVIMEPGLFHLGTFNITTEEFMYLTLSSRSDLADASVLVFDPNGALLLDGGVDGGDTELHPFKTSGPGMYIVFIMMMPYDDNLCILDVLLEAVTPIDLPIGGFAEGVLNGSEYFVDTEDGSLLHQEKAPNAVTYKFSTNTTMPGVITHSMNLPDLDTDTYSWYYPRIHITSNASEDFFFEARYTDSPDPNGDPYYYQSFQNETYYMTFIGLENVEYIVHNEYAIIGELPVNEKFYIENDIANVETKAYSLSLSQDSVLRVNSSEEYGGYTWNFFSVFEDNCYRQLSVIDNPSFDNAAFYYLPAGEYIVKASCGNDQASGFYDFNLGPVIDGLGAVAVDVGSLIGLRFDTNVLDWYNVSMSFNTRDNVTAGTDVYFFNTFGGQVHSHDLELGNRQSGLGWVEFNSNYTSWVLENFCEGFGIVVISPYDIYNNTGGLPGSELSTYSLDYTVNVEDGFPWVFNGTASTSLDTGGYNFTLGDPGDSSESYWLNLEGEVGQWLNVSVSVEDVDSWTCAVFQKVDGTPQILYWGNLDDTFTGSYSGEASFQFGCISDNISLYFSVQRTQAGEGRLDIAFDEFTMNTFEYMPPPMFLGQIIEPGIDMGLVALGIGIAVVAGVVVVIVIIIKKKPELLGRFKK